MYIYTFIWVSGPSEIREVHKFIIIYVYMYIFIYVNTDGLIRLHEDMNTCTYIHLYIFIHKYIWVSGQSEIREVRICVDIYVNLYTCIYQHLYAYVYI
jgi:hypothetical protein